jgi:uncharacterized peroxidase-related enzyme
MNKPQSPRLDPLPADANPELAPFFARSLQNLGFVPNSMLILQRRPEIMKAFSALSASIYGEGSTVDYGFKRLVAHVGSRAAGCLYCMAHTTGGALRFGISEEKFKAVWDFERSDLYTSGEKAALTMTIAAVQTPNAVSDEHFEQMRKYWREEQIVEIVATISVFGFLNRWNDTMGTPLEDEPLETGERFLSDSGWTPGKHAR